MPFSTNYPAQQITRCISTVEGRRFLISGFFKVTYNLCCVLLVAACRSVNTVLQKQLTEEKDSKEQILRERDQLAQVRSNPLFYCLSSTEASSLLPWPFMLTVVSSAAGERDQRNRAGNSRKGIERALPFPRVLPLPAFSTFPSSLGSFCGGERLEASIHTEEHDTTAVLPAYKTFIFSSENLDFHAKLLSSVPNWPFPDCLSKPLSVKTSLGAHRFISKCDFIHMKIKIIFSIWMVVSRPRFDRRAYGNSEIGYKSKILYSYVLVSS